VTSSAPGERAVPKDAGERIASPGTSVRDDGRLLSYPVEAAIVAAFTRAAILAVVIAAAYVAHRHGQDAGGMLHRLLTDPWTRKDAGWFVHIARDGYGGSAGRPAFFPLYPLLVRLASFVTLGDYWLAGLLVSLASYAAAMVLLFRLAAAEAGRRAAARTVVLISVFPTAFVFSAVYSESLFLLLTVAAFWFARRRRWAVACLAGFLATLTRSSGIVLVVPLLLMFAGQQGWTTRRRPSLLRRDDLRAAWLLLIPAGLAAYMLYLWAEFGDATRFASVQRTVWHRAVDWPWLDVWRGARAATRGIDAVFGHLALLPSGLLPGERLEVLIARNLLPFGALLFAALCLWPVFRRLPLPYGVYAALALLVPLLEPSSQVPLYSYHRFVLVVFPLFMGLGIVLEKRTKLFWVLASASFVLMLYLAVCFTSASTAAHGVV
jgi:Mannosyltransferase (PIG-V)